MKKFLATTLTVAAFMAAAPAVAEERFEVTVKKLTPLKIAHLLFQRTAPGATFEDFLSVNDHLAHLQENQMLGVGTKYYRLVTTKFENG